MISFALYCVDRFTKQYINDVLKKAENEYCGNALIVQENDESNETDENYVKPFTNWTSNEIKDYNVKKYGPTGKICSTEYFAILSKESASEGMFDVCINDEDENEFTIHRVRFELGSTCFINIDLKTLDIDVSQNVFHD